MYLLFEVHDHIPYVFIDFGFPAARHCNQSQSLVLKSSINIVLAKKSQFLL